MKFLPPIARDLGLMGGKTLRGRGVIPTAHFGIMTKFTFQSWTLESEPLNLPFTSLSALESEYIRSEFPLLVENKANID